MIQNRAERKSPPPSFGRSPKLMSKSETEGVRVMNRDYEEIFTIEGLEEIRRVFRIANSIMNDGIYAWYENQAVACIHVACRMMELVRA